MNDLCMNPGKYRVVDQIETIGKCPQSNDDFSREETEKEASLKYSRISCFGTFVQFPYLLFRKHDMREYFKDASSPSLLY